MSLREICSNLPSQLNALTNRAIAGARPYLDKAANHCPSINKRTGTIAVAALAVVTVVGVVVRSIRAKRANVAANKLQVAAFMARPSWHLELLITKAKQGDTVCINALQAMHARKPVNGYTEIMKEGMAAKKAALEAQKARLDTKTA